MQENRAFDHYFGTLAGVRGFSDPNVQVNSGRQVWYQNVNSNLTNATDYLLPWYLNYEGGFWLNATQCMYAGSNGWNENQAALDGDLNDRWATNNTPWSWGHFKRSDIPVQFAIADGWTVGDMYQESVIASTNPNRVTWVSGSINIPGGAQTPSEGGLYIDNNEVPGCEAPGLNCYPLEWKTTPEFYQDAGVTWQVFQDTDNFDDNPLAWFKQYQTAPNGTALSDRGMAFLGLDDFYARAKNGTLPEISYIIGPTELSEHQPYSPRDGAWLQKQVVDAVTGGASYNTTVLIISFDGTSFTFFSYVVFSCKADHDTCHQRPVVGVTMLLHTTHLKERLVNGLRIPMATLGTLTLGKHGHYKNSIRVTERSSYRPGFRLPFYIISPWTRGGSVFTERADHNSQIMFIEKWQAAKGKNVYSNQVAAWRRAHMSDLTNAFNFDAPDLSIPELPNAPAPHKNSKGQYDGSSYCESLYAVQRPPVPYGKQSTDVASLSETGFKSVRGNLTEGRYLTFESSGYALTNPGKNAMTFTATKATANHSSINQRWVVTQLAEDGNTFLISSALDGLYIGNLTSLTNNSGIAEQFSIRFLGNGKGYSLQNQNGMYLRLATTGAMSFASTALGFLIFSVT